VEAPDFETASFKLAQHIEAAHGREWRDAVEIAENACNHAEFWVEEEPRVISSRSRSPPRGRAAVTSSSSSSLSTWGFKDLLAMDTASLQRFVAAGQRELTRRKAE